MKVWSVGTSTGLLEAAPDVELVDHDTPVQCTAIDGACRHVAAGAEDGSVILWTISAAAGVPGGRAAASGAPSHSVVFHRQVSPAGK